MADNSDVIDSLLVSLGLDTDSKSFQEGNDAVRGIKDGILQLAAAAGVAISFKGIIGLGQTVVEMDRLAKNTRFTIEQIDGLQHAMRRLNLPAEAAFDIAQKIPQIAQSAREGKLGTAAYYSNLFRPEEFARLEKESPMEALRYLAEVYPQLNISQKRTLRAGLGAGDNDPFTRLLEGGRKGIDESLNSYQEYAMPIDQALVDSTNKFNEEMANLTLNFTNLGRSIANDLLPYVNAFLELINNFIKEHPDISKGLLVAASAGAGVSALGLIKKFLPGGGGGAGGAAGKGLLSSLLLNPYTIGLTAAFSPGNVFTSDEDVRAMSNPDAVKRSNWAINNPGIPYPEDKFSPQALLNNQKSKDSSNLFKGLEQENGLPSGLIDAVWNKESARGTHPTMVSSAGALGHFQFKPKTGAEYGLNKREDFFDLEKSSKAAAKYLSKLYKMYDGDIDKTLAAYNWGMGNLDEKGLNNMPSETSDYIYNIRGQMGLPQSFVAMNNTPPVMASNTGSTGQGVALTQHNEFNITTTSGDENSTRRIVREELADNLNQTKSLLLSAGH